LNSKPKLSKKGGIEKNAVYGQEFLQNEYNFYQNSRLTKSLNMSHLCKNRIKSSFALNNCILNMLNVEKNIKNINIKLT
jgi:hypothetical protein